MDYKLAGELITRDEIQKRVAELGEEIGRDYCGKDLVVVAILKGAVIFMADLVRHIPATVNVTLDFMAVSSYGDSTMTNGIVRIVKDLDTSVKDKNVLVVEDIVDTGLTLSYLLKLMNERDPENVRVCALLTRKREERCTLTWLTGVFPSPTNS